MPKFNNKGKVKEKAIEVIRSVIALFDSFGKNNKFFSERYSKIVRKVSTRSRLKVPRDIKRRICKHCYAILIPGNNCRVRLRPKHRMIVYQCNSCKKYTKFGY